MNLSTYLVLSLLVNSISGLGISYLLRLSGGQWSYTLHFLIYATGAFVGMMTYVLIDEWLKAAKR